MSWQVLVILQILAGSLLAIWVRHVSINSRHYALSIGFVSFVCIAIMGQIYSFAYLRSLPSLPTGVAWLYLLLEGIFIPSAWIFQFKLVSHIGASNGVIASTLNSLGAASLGLLFLGESLSASFVLGTSLILSAIYLSMNIKPDKTHSDNAPLKTKALLLMGAIVCFSLGMFFEKKAIGVIGVWQYASIGWAMQFVGAFVLYLIFGKGQLMKMPKTTLKKAVVIGVLTSVAGLLFILALSKGTLSHTIVASSGKIAVTMVLAAIFLRERNNILMRVSAFLLATIGIFCIMI